MKETMTKKNFGEHLCQLRTSFGITQDKIAEYLGVDQSLISKVEKGERSLEMSNIEKLASLYCKSLEEILYPSETDNKYKLAFRTKELNENDMVSLAAVNRIILNHKQLEALED